MLLTERFEKEMYLDCPMLSDCKQLKPNINGIPDGILRKGGNEKALINQGFIQSVWRRDSPPFINPTNTNNTHQLRNYFNLNI